MTFEGGGSFVLDPGVASIVGAADAGAILDNDGTLTGAGEIGNGGVTALTFNNSGTLDADVAAGTLTIDTGSTVTNTGTMEATNGATLQIDDSVDNKANGVILATGAGSDVTIDPATVTNAGEIAAENGGTIDIDDSTIDNTGDGFIEATGPGSAIDLDQATITGGTLETSAGGVIQTVADSGNSTFDNLTITAGSQVEVNDGTSLTLEGTIDNDGTITLEAGTDPALVIDGAVTLEGSGTVILSGGADAIVGAGTGANTLDNQETIAGSGAIGDGGVTVLALTNGGTIDADVAGGTLTIDTGSTVTNSGTLEATKGATLQIDGSVDNTANGVILATGAGSDVTIDPATATNAGEIAAENGGTIDIDGSTIDNTGDGFIEATGPGSAIDLDQATISGGTLETSAGGVIQTVADSGNSTFDNLTIAAGSQVDVNNGTSLTLQGTIDNDGTITLEAGTDPALVIDGAVTLEGSGTVILSGSADIIVGAGTGANTLDNQETIAGSGEIGNAGVTALALTNIGTIDADVANGMLTIDTSSTVTNTGTLEATNGATLWIKDSVNNTGGIITALGSGATVQLSGAIDIAGGTLKTGDARSAAQGMIEILAAGAVMVLLDGSANAVTIDAYVQVDAGATLGFEGTIDNAGTVVLASGADLPSDLAVVGNVTLQGGGQIILTAGGGNAILSNGAAATLTNVDNTIAGAGTIGDADLTLVNAHGGTIDANVSGATLTIDTGNNQIANSGTLEATHGGVLVIDSGLDNSGLVLASHGGQIQIEADVHNNSSGLIGAESCGTITFDGVSVVNDGGIGAKLDGAITFDHSHVVNNGGADDRTGGIGATSGGAILFVHSDVCNNGNIGADDGGLITFDHSHAVNSGAFYAGANGEIDIDASTIDNQCGVIQSSGANSSVQLSNATIIGGTLESCGGGIIETEGGNSTFSCVTITDGSEVLINDGTSLTLEGTIVNNGTIDVDEEAAGANLVIGGCVTLDGSGTVTLAGSNDAIVAGCDGGTLYNANAIVGTGTIGGDDLALVNEACGVIDANVSAATLVVDTGWTTICNSGLMEATCGGVLQINSDVDNTRSGLIEAIGGGSVVDLDWVTITGGTLETSCGGLIQTICDTTTFDDLSIACGSQVQVDDGSALALQGTIDNAGTITLVAGGDPDLVIDGCVTLDGNGLVVLDGAGDYIVGQGGEDASTLHNDSGIAGAGTIGGDGLILVNEACGTVDADVGGQTLAIDTGHDVSNAGLMEATNGGTLQIADAVCNSGLLSASCGGTLDITAGSITWSGDTATPGTNGIVLDHGTLLVDSASLTLDGGGAVAIDCGSISAASAGDTLHNADAISGTGTIGCGGLVLDNDGCGVIDANVGGGTLTIDTGCNSITNLGTLEASNGGILNIASAVDNCGGMLLANSGGLLDVQSCISGGNATIAGGTLEFGAASNVNVTFCNGSSDAPTYGTLVLGDAAQFCGQIDGFAGTAGDASHSDTVELAGICETSYCVQFSGNNEILTINYGDDQHVTLTFDDFSASFTIVDKDGNTYIYDPPKTGADDKSPIPDGPSKDGDPTGATADHSHVNGGPVGVTGTLSNDSHVGSAPLNLVGTVVGDAAHADGVTATAPGTVVGTLGQNGATTGTAADALTSHTTTGAFVGVPPPADALPAHGSGTLTAASQPADGLAAHSTGAFIAAPQPAGDLPAHTTGAFSGALPPAGDLPAHSTGAFIGTSHIGGDAPVSGASTAWGLNFGADQFQPAHAALTTQAAGSPGAGSSHPGTVSMALGSGQDAFVFHSEFGGGTFASASAPPAHVDHIEGAASLETQLAALLTSEHLGGVTAEAIHTDSIATSGMDQFHQMVASVAHLH